MQPQSHTLNGYSHICYSNRLPNLLVAIVQKAIIICHLVTEIRLVFVFYPSYCIAAYFTQIVRNLNTFLYSDHQNPSKLTLKNFQVLLSLIEVCRIFHSNYNILNSSRNFYTIIEFLVIGIESLDLQDIVSEFSSQPCYQNSHNQN